MPGGAPLQLKGGDASSPMQVFFGGMRTRGLTSEKFGLIIWKLDSTSRAAAAGSVSELSALEQAKATMAKSRNSLAVRVRSTGALPLLMIPHAGLEARRFALPFNNPACSPRHPKNA